MKLVAVDGIDPASIENAVGGGAYTRGVRYVQRQAVVSMQWDDEDDVLFGTVRGSGDDLYATAVYFIPGDRGELEFNIGECSCPVGFDCKHAAALAVAAAGVAAAPAAPSPGQPAGTWERSLGSLLEPSRNRGQGREGDTPLAVELTLSHAGPASWRGASSAPAGCKLQARLVQPGKTGWVGGKLSWSTLGTLHYDWQYSEAQVRVLQELYALYQSRSRLPYYYGYRDDKTIDLAAFDSHQLWPLLDEAATAGVALVHSRKSLGAVERHGHGRICLDVTGGKQQGSLAVAPVLRLDGADADAMPVAFIGADGHGVVYATAAEAGYAVPADRPIRLARLARPVPAPLQRMVLDGQRLEIPAGELDRFRDEYYPQLRHLAPVVSSDESFTPPAISEPTLVLHASYGSGHDLGLSWEWAYEVGDAQLRAPLTGDGAEEGFRDPAAERELLDSLDVPLDRFGLLADEPQRRPRARADLGGLDTMRFSTEALPLLRDTPGVAVEVDGQPPDYREAGDSLRIGFSTDEVAGQTDWFDLGVSISVEGREIPFTDVFVALAADEPYLLCDDGAYFSLEKPELQALRGLIEEARALQDAPSGPLRISRYQAGLWDELTELGVIDRQARAWQQQVTGLLALDSVPTTEPPATLSAQLRPYQHDGFAWLAFLWQFRLGGILADDMGLGKTLQSLALIAHAKQADPTTGPFLIVAPTSVVATWSSEAARFTPDLAVAPVTDTLRRRGRDLDEIIAGADVVVTSYTLFRLDVDAYSALDWSGLILDEAQYVKNHQSKTHQCARRLAAPFKLAITGTPMENNLMELWSLLSITAPGLFPNPTPFRDHYARPIEKGADPERLGAFRRRIKPLMKRRTKELVAADLPDKQEQVLEVELEPKHRRIYQRHLQRERQKVLGLIDDVQRHRFTILRSLTLLRQLSLHAGLVDAEYQELSSAKIDALVTQLTDVIDGGHRALVFSQFTGFLDHVRRRLEAAGVAYSYLDGSTRNRPAVVRQFKDGAAPVFLISLKAGGFGLNLTEADYCFLLDPWWNPATETQAVDRTHRIGQTRNVMVYRLIAKDTIEEKVLALASRKAELFAGVMDDGNMFGSSLDADEIRELLS